MEISQRLSLRTVKELLKFYFYLQVFKPVNHTSSAMLSTAALPERNLAYLKHSETYQNEKNPSLRRLLSQKTLEKVVFFTSLFNIFSFYMSASEKSSHKMNLGISHFLILPTLSVMWTLRSWPTQPDVLASNSIF